MTSPDPLYPLRQETQAVLERAVGEGRLDLGEFSELAGLVWSTDDPKQLEKLILESHVGSELSPFGEPPAPREASGTAIAVLSDHKRTGNWVIPKEMTVVSVLGDVNLDLCEATPSSLEIVINATLVLSDLKITVPPGVQVYSDNNAILSDNKIESSAPLPGAPKVFIKGLSVLSDIKVKVNDPNTQETSWWRRVLGS